MFEARTRRARFVLQLLTTIVVVPFSFPLIAMLAGSLVGDGFANYSAVLARPELPLFFRNSVIIAAATIAIVYVVTLLAAFGYAKLRIRNREVYFWMLLICLTLPEIVLITPLFVTAMRLGVYDTYLAVILPLAALQVPFTVLLARNFVGGIPDDFMDAARIDGCNTLRGFVHVIVPLTRPIGAALIVLCLIASWNTFLFPIVFLTDPSTQTVTQVPQFFIGEFTYDQTKVLAASVLAAAPEVLAYLSLQRFFERGMTAGALK